MRIVLLGHDDAASLFAMSLLVDSRPAHDYSVFLSGALAGGAAPPALVELAAADRALCDSLRNEGRIAPKVRQATELPAPNSPDGLAVLRAAAPDVVVSIRYRRILRPAAIAIPRHGVLNLHSGILPDYAGVMATFWALSAGEAEIGCTLHRIVDSGIDTGPVIGIERRRADPAGSYLGQVLSLYPAGVGLVAGALDELEGGREPAARAQPPGLGRYFSTPGPADLERFLRAGRRLADGREPGWLQNYSRTINYHRNY